jgi:hypothetical protein
MKFSQNHAIILNKLIRILNFQWFLIGHISNIWVEIDILKQQGLCLNEFNMIEKQIRNWNKHNQAFDEFRNTKMIN